MEDEVNILATVGVPVIEASKSIAPVVALMLKSVGVPIPVASSCCSNCYICKSIVSQYVAEPDENAAAFCWKYCNSTSSSYTSATTC